MNASRSAVVLIALAAHAAHATPATWVPVKMAAQTGAGVVTGKVAAVAPHPTDPRILYVGAERGGVFVTTDGGATWRPLTDGKLRRAPLAGGPRKGTTSIATLAVDPARPSTIYVGTGEAHPGTKFWYGPRLGVFRSTDSGVNWQPLGLDPSCPGNQPMSSALVSRLAVASSTELFAATDWGIFKYPSAPGADCWAQMPILPPVDAVTWDQQCNPAKKDRAACDAEVRWDSARSVLYAAQPGRGVYRSTDRGATWASFMPPNLPAGFGFGRVVLALAPSQPGTIFVVFFDTGVPPRQLYVGVHGGEPSRPVPRVPAAPPRVRTHVVYRVLDGAVPVWTKLTPIPPEGGNGGGESLAVNPSDPTEIFLGDQYVWWGGPQRSWTNVSFGSTARAGDQVHADVQELAFGPGGTTLYAATDGGLYRAQIAAGVATWSSLSEELPIGQIGKVDATAWDPQLLAAGVWHNGTIVRDLDVPGPGIEMVGDDGHFARFDAFNPTGIGAAGWLYLNQNAGDDSTLMRMSWDYSTMSSSACPDDCVILTKPREIWVDPFHQLTLFRLDSSNQLWRSGGTSTLQAYLALPSSWTNMTLPWTAYPAGNARTGALAVKPPRTPTDPPVYFVGLFDSTTGTSAIYRGSPEANWVVAYSGVARVSALGVDYAPGVERVIATFDALQTDPAITDAPAGVAGVVDIRANPGGGFTSTAIGAGMAAFPEVLDYQSVAIDPVTNAVYLATNQGLFEGNVTTNSWTWERATSIPDLWVTDLRVHRASGAVRAAASGRSVYQVVHGQPVLTGGATQHATVHLVTGWHSSFEHAGHSQHPHLPSAALRARLAGEEREATAVDVPGGAKVVLHAPPEAQAGGQRLVFAGWSVGGERFDAPVVALRPRVETTATALYDLPEHVPVVVRVRAFAPGEDSYDVARVSLLVSVDGQPASSREAPFDLRLRRGARVKLTAPASVGGRLQFRTWEVAGLPGTASTVATFEATRDSELRATFWPASATAR